MKRTWIAMACLALASVAYAQINTSPIRRVYSQSATITEFSISVSASNFEVAVANTDRIGFEMHNNGTATIYCRRSTSSAAISAGSYSVPIGPGGFYEDPEPVYTGEWNCIGDAADGYVTGVEKEL